MTDLADLWTTLAGDGLTTLASLVELGGAVVVILLALSVVAGAVVIMKAVQFLALGVGRRGRVDAALSAWLAGDRQSALHSTLSTRGALAHVVGHAMQGLTRGVDEQLVREDADRVANVEWRAD